MTSFFEPTASASFLISYIKENPECPLEDIINDDELIDTLKYNNEALFT